MFSASCLMGLPVRQHYAAIRFVRHFNAEDKMVFFLFPANPNGPIRTFVMAFRIRQTAARQGFDPEPAVSGSSRFQSADAAVEKVAYSAISIMIERRFPDLPVLLNRAPLLPYGRRPMTHRIQPGRIRVLQKQLPGFLSHAMIRKREKQIGCSGKSGG